MHTYFFDKSSSMLNILRLIHCLFLASFSDVEPNNKTNLSIYVIIKFIFVYFYWHGRKHRNDNSLVFLRRSHPSFMTIDRTVKQTTNKTKSGVINHATNLLECCDDVICCESVKTTMLSSLQKSKPILIRPTKLTDRFTHSYASKFL